jgi:uncharacterized OB-fold protein
MTHLIDLSAAPRMLPQLNDVNRAFWTGGARGQLLILRCGACGRWVHPPTTATCAQCDGELRPEPVSGNGRVFTFTVNHQQYHPDVPTPYVIAIVVLDEQDDLRLPTNLVDVEPDSLECGMRVRVRFEPRGEVTAASGSSPQIIYVPVFQPAGEG